MDFHGFERGDAMKGSQEGDAAQGKKGAEQEGRVWPSVGVKDNKERLKRLLKLLVDNSGTNERSFQTAPLD